MKSVVLPFIPGDSPGEPFDSLLQEFLLTLYQGQYSKGTIISYGWHLRRCFRWLISAGVVDLKQINAITMLTWGIALREKYQPQTQKVAITAAVRFFAWLLEEKKLVNENPALKLQVPKISIEKQRTLSLMEIQALMDKCPNTVKGIRDRAIICVLLDTGIRAAELCNIETSNLNLVDCRLNVLCKGGAHMDKFFGPICKHYLEIWMQYREKMEPVPASTVFVSVGGFYPGTSLTPRGLRIILRNLGIAAGIEDVHPHAFRRSFASLRIAMGQSTRSVQILGGWSDLKSFERYTLALTNDDDFMRQGAAKYSPLLRVENLSGNDK